MPVVSAKSHLSSWLNLNFRFGMVLGRLKIPGRKKTTSLPERFV